MAAQTRNDAFARELRQLLNKCDGMQTKEDRALVINEMMHLLNRRDGRRFVLERGREFARVVLQKTREYMYHPLIRSRSNYDYFAFDNSRVMAQRAVYQKQRARL